MHHSVTVRTQTMTTSSSTIVINIGYLKNFNGILKLLQLALGIVCVGIIGNEYNTYHRNAPECFFLVITVTFMINTFILLLSCLMSLSTASIISKTIYEFLYHSIAFGLLFAASLTLLIHVNNYKRSLYNYELLLSTSICGLINACMYLFSTILAFRTYRGF